MKVQGVYFIPTVYRKQYTSNQQGYSRKIWHINDAESEFCPCDITKFIQFVLDCLLAIIVKLCTPIYFRPVMNHALACLSVKLLSKEYSIYIQHEGRNLYFCWPH